MNTRNYNIACSIRAGITMAETVVSTMIVGFVIIATLQIVGPMVRSTSVHTDRLVAANLANELTEEISMHYFADPSAEDPDAIGTDTGERAINRGDFDDVDDYHGWSSSPPKLSSNQENVMLPSWTRSVTVEHVELSDASTSSKTYTGLKRITVTVSKNGTKLAQIHSLHSSGADQVGFVVSAGGS